MAIATPLSSFICWTTRWSAKLGSMILVMPVIAYYLQCSICKNPQDILRVLSRDSIIPTHDPSNPPRLVNFRTHFRFSGFFVFPPCRMRCMKHSRATSSVSAEHSRNYYHLWRPCCSHLACAE